MPDEPVLSDLGERRIVEEILRPRYDHGDQSFGDDCAILGQPGALPDGACLVATTDPSPRPVAAILGFTDPYYEGWLLATANLSDLAAAGAHPLGLMTSLTLPADTTVRDFERLLDGVDNCCASCGTGVLGGNVRDGGLRELVATAVGYCLGPPFSRAGARPGDSICVVGRSGLFWASVLHRQAGLRLSADDEAALSDALLMPRPQTALSARLHDEGVVSACLDNSDGLYPSLLTLAGSSRLGCVVDLDHFSPPPAVLSVAEQLGIDSRRLATGWGDWELVVTVTSSALPYLIAEADASGTSAQAIGCIVKEPGVTVRLAGRDVTNTLPDSERFSPSSWFSHGLDNYQSTLTRSRRD